MGVGTWEDLEDGSWALRIRVPTEDVRTRRRSRRDSPAPEVETAVSWQAHVRLRGSRWARRVLTRSPEPVGRSDADEIAQRALDGYPGRDGVKEVVVTCAVNGEPSSSLWTFDVRWRDGALVAERRRS